MSPDTLQILRCLIFAEPFATIAVLLAWMRAGKLGSGMPAMRDYLVARSANAAVNICLFCVWTHAHAGPGSWQQSVYLYEYWLGFFVLSWFMLRVAGDVAQRFLRSLLGLQALVKVAFRWVLVAAMLLALPAGVAFGIAFVRSTPHLEVLFRFFAVISIAQLFPLSSVMILGLYAGCRPSRRDFGILVAFCLEPAWMLATSWIHDAGGVLIWANLVTEIVCYAAFAIWTWYAFHPDREDHLPTPNTTLQRWDQLARKALRHRLPLAEEPESVLQGARPQPRPND